MSDQERHKGCGGWIYSHHQGNEWFLFCQKCGLKTNVYDTHAKARMEWDKMVEPQTESESEGKPSFWWKCERCGKLIPYMADFCHECAYELFGEPPKPFELQESGSEGSE